MTGRGLSTRREKVEFLIERTDLWVGKILNDYTSFAVRCALVDANLSSRKTTTYDVGVGSLVASAAGRVLPFNYGELMLPVIPGPSWSGLGPDRVGGTE